MSFFYSPLPFLIFRVNALRFFTLTLQVTFRFGLVKDTKEFLVPLLISLDRGMEKFRAPSVGTWGNFELLFIKGIFEFFLLWLSDITNQFIALLGLGEILNSFICREISSSSICISIGIYENIQLLRTYCGKVKRKSDDVRVRTWTWDFYTWNELWSLNVPNIILPL